MWRLEPQCVRTPLAVGILRGRAPSWQLGLSSGEEGEQSLLPGLPCPPHFHPKTRGMCVGASVKPPLLPQEDGGSDSSQCPLRVRLGHRQTQPSAARAGSSQERLCERQGPLPTPRPRAPGGCQSGPVARSVPQSCGREDSGVDGQAAASPVPTRGWPAGPALPPPHPASSGPVGKNRGG